MKTRKEIRESHKMRHNRWKKYLKIVCSWILIFSICCLSLNVAKASDTIVEMESESQETEDFISDIENQQTEPVIESEILADDEQLPESEQLLESEVQPSPEPEKIPETEDIIPECVEVELLKAEIQKDTTSETVPTTDRVEYIDENGNFIQGPPTKIALGKIEDHRVAYVDVNGNPIAGAPSVIKFGAIADHKELSIQKKI